MNRPGLPRLANRRGLPRLANRLGLPRLANRPSLPLLARGLTVAAGIALLVALFLTWTSMSLQQLALLAVTANGNLGRVSLSQNAWALYPGVAAALTAVALAVIATGGLGRRALVLPVGLVCLAAAVFVGVQLGDPPSAQPALSRVTVPSSGVAAHSTTGAGEPVALVALGLAVVGMWAMLAAAHAQRRSRRRAHRRRALLQAGRRRQPVTGSAGRSSRSSVPAGEPADGSA